MLYTVFFINNSLNVGLTLSYTQILFFTLEYQARYKT